MDMVEATNEFNDWEVLQRGLNSDAIPVTRIDSVNSFDEIDSGRLIRANYFSLDSLDRYGEDFDDNKSAGSDNPSWVDPGLDENPTRYLDRETAGFWSDSGGERPVDRKIEDSDGRNVTKTRISMWVLIESRKWWSKKWERWRIRGTYVQIRRDSNPLLRKLMTLWRILIRVWMVMCFCTITQRKKSVRMR